MVGVRGVSRLPRIKIVESNFMELTEQKFEQILDKKLANFATKDELKLGLADIVTKNEFKLGMSQMVSKDEFNAAKVEFKNALEKQSKELRDFAREQTSELGAMIAEQVAIPLREHIEKCEGVWI